MRNPWMLALVLAAATAAGCVSTPEAPQGTPGTWLAGHAIPDAGTTWDVPQLAYPPDPVPCVSYECLAASIATCGPALACPAPPCDASSCADATFEVRGAAAHVEFWLQPQALEGSARPHILDAAGHEIGAAAEGEYTNVVVADLEPGTYTLRAQAVYGTDSYLGIVRTGAPGQALSAAWPPAAPGAARDLLPDLVTLAPRDLRIAAPPDESSAAAGILGTPGCDAYEAVEAAAHRCLRFSNAIANVGDGPMEVRLATTQLATGAAGAANFSQVVYRSDGTTRQAAAGPATFHPTHQHYHYAGLALYTVYAYDLAHGARGAPVNEGHKSGFCFLDGALADVGHPRTLPRYFDAANCFHAVYTPMDAALAQNASYLTADESMGIERGWLDDYNWFLDDQFVDMTGAPDGVYELASCANPQHTILELDPANDCASVLFRLTGDNVTSLGAPPTP